VRTRAVIFDLYETLVTEGAAPATRAGSLGPTIGVDATAWRRAWKPRRRLVIRGALSFHDALVDSAAAVGVRLAPQLAQQIVDQRAAGKRAVFDRIDPEITVAVQRLRSIGLRLGVISNGFAEDVAPWRTSSLAREFTCALFSCETRNAKPEPEIYRTTLSLLGVAADAAIYIGDGADDELAGALRVGLRIAAARWFVQEPRELPAEAVVLARCDAVFSTLE
jgi:putative hydrolase of the HAD superfamily